MSSAGAADSAASTLTLLRLALAGGRSDRLRIILTVVGSALATVILLLGVTIAFIRTSSGDGPYSIGLIDQSGLRPGVLIGLSILLVPVVMFVGLCTRVGAPARDRRLAMFRMAGATPSQTTRIAAYETGIAALVGAIAGLAAFQILRFVLNEGSVSRRRFPTDVAVPGTATALVVVAVAVAAALASAVAMRNVRVSPFGVTRISSSKSPVFWALMLFLLGSGGLIAMGALSVANLSDGGFQVILLASLILFVCCLVGLLLGSTALATKVGGFLAERTSRPDVLIAARRMVAAPNTSSRATASVLIAVLIGSAVQGARVAYLASTGTDRADPFYTDSFDLINVVLVIAIVIAAASLVVTSSEAVVERRRTLAALAASGVPRSVLARAAVFESLVPLVPAVTLAGISGALAARSFFGTSVESSGVTVEVGFPVVGVLAVILGAIAASVVATLISLVFLPASTSAAELRTAA